MLGSRTVAVLNLVSQLEDRRQPTTTLEGWRRFVEAEPTQFALLAEQDWNSLSGRERVDYDEARIAHHAELVVVPRPRSPRSPTRAAC